MINPTPHEITNSLVEWSNGDESAPGKLIPLVVKELNRLAHPFMSRGPARYPVQGTELINLAYRRHAFASHPGLQKRAHFFAFAANPMRQTGEAL